MELLAISFNGMSGQAVLAVVLAIVALAAILVYFFVFRPGKYGFFHAGNLREQALFAAKGTAKAVKKKVVPEQKLRP